MKNKFALFLGWLLLMALAVSEAQAEEKALLAAGGVYTCALDAEGLACWGWNEDGQSDVPPRFRTNRQVSAIAAGWRHTCALDAEGLACWGWNDASQRDVPARFRTNRQVSAIAAGWGHTCTLDADGLACWGYNEYGQSDVPTRFQVNRSIWAIAAGGWHTCALDAEGLDCWGANGYGQSDVPPRFRTNRQVSAIAAGWGHTCTLDADGLACWGYNEYGQTNVPARFSSNRQVKAIAAGDSHTCAADADGLACWGANGYGQSDVPERFLKPFYDFSLESFEKSLTLLAEEVYPYKAIFFSKVARLVAALPQPTDEFTHANLVAILSRLFALKALRPVMESIETEHFEKEILPRYQEALSQNEARHDIKNLEEFVRRHFFSKISLELIQAAWESCRTFVATEENLQHYSRVMSELGRALSAEPRRWDIYAAVGVFSAFHESQALLREFSDNPRTRGLGLMIQSLLEYLRI